MSKRRNGRHWQAEGRPSVYAIRHRLHNELRPTGRFFRNHEIHVRDGVEYVVFKNVRIWPGGSGNGEGNIGELVVTLPPSGDGQLPTLDGAS